MSSKLPAELAEKAARFEQEFPELRGLLERVVPDDQREREIQRSRAIRENMTAAERRARRLALARECLEAKHGRQLRDFAAAMERQHAGLTDQAVDQIMRALNEHRKGKESR